MRWRLDRLVLGIAIAVAPGCAVIDGLGGGEDEGSNDPVTPGSQPDGGGVVDPPRDASTGPQDGGFGTMDAQIASAYVLDFMPDLIDACEPGSTVLSVLIQVMPGGALDGGFGPLRVQGDITPMNVNLEIRCEPNGDVFALGMGSGDVEAYTGSFTEVVSGAGGTFTMTRTQ